MSLYPLQRLLERIYAVEIGYQVDDFLVTDPQWVAQVDTSPDARLIKEKLLVMQQDDALELSLFLDPEVISCLAEHDPFQSLHDENLQAFLLALEGVSHFLYLGWNAGLDRSVTLLELELQAEVDKYVSALSLIRKQFKGRVPQELRARLFERCIFDGTLQEGQLTRYKDANRYAGKYCWQLENRYLKRKQVAAMWQDLRHFYRLPQGQKLRRIDFS